MTDTTKKPRARRLHPFEKELIASIENEKRTFHMKEFVVGGNEQDFGETVQVASCKTASCMAGHIEALRRPLAKRLAAKEEFQHGNGDPSHSLIAEEIYRRETGRDCPLDFFGDLSAKGFDELTRDEAVAHIKGINPEWPLHSWALNK
jgi:hypothetical protein